MTHKIITAVELDGRRVYLDFDERSTGYPCWLYSNPQKFTDEIELNKEVNNIVTDFNNQEGYYYNSRVMPNSLEVQTIGVVDSEPIKLNVSQYEIDKKKAQEILAEINLSTEDLELVLRMAKA